MSRPTGRHRLAIPVPERWRVTTRPVKRDALLGRILRWLFVALGGVIGGLFVAFVACVTSLMVIWGAAALFSWLMS